MSGYLKEIELMVRSWLADPLADLGLLARVHGEELTTLERAGAGADGDAGASALFEEFDRRRFRQEASR